uniref:Adenine nucleotide transporter n=1 Tax=Kwoniella bestiolae CBS 10118 TaxID=1296100 RepID=A0A1B9G4I0_9TREE|nr:adenine nucleotide transporter [Kwoniella bestiolae CBS 10118]OCF25912.1 adenine nucleotide transporter [Kwoniella bestiolae CBS 10118]
MAPHPHPPLTPFGSALAGALGSVFANAAVYPLDTVKTRLQAEDEEDDEEVKPEGELPLTNEAEKAESSKQNEQIKAIRRYVNKKIKSWGMLMMLLRILKEDGIAGAFHGFGASMIGTFSQQFAYFFFHTLLRTSYIRRLPSSSPVKGPSTPSVASLSTSAELLLGALAGGLAQIFTIPVQVIATRQQLWRPLSKGNMHAPSLMETAQEIISENGLTGLWTGLKPGLVLTVNPAITYGVFERLKTYRLSRKPEGQGHGKLGVGEAFWLGVSSKMLATVVTYPYIFAKVRLQAKATPEELQYDAEHPPLTKTETGMGNDPTPSYASVASAPPAFGSATVDLPKETQTQGGRPGLARQHSHKYHHHHRHALSLLKAVYREHGVRGWYKGLGAQIVKAVLCQGILFVSKDQFESYAWLLLVFFAKLRKRISPV